ncbi:PACE efflux transporter [Ferrimonas lipolytica]|uniref:PACE efflux transporter n=1 Tax=Ferrimonas lipolytica TaxID=2724191 RepID=A0A6H1U9T4_9GAMM|nr:PACE efflux transporter [Ferrimonas lipolytica]QIZ75815.1 PACE efflux transporter [Ferrimonas lipolytica]
MTTKDRVIHSVLFEVIGLILLVPVASLISGVAPSIMTGIAVLVSLIAMAWNYGYNVLFDKLFGQDRINRGLIVRMAHSAGFEIGLLSISLPLLVLMTGMGWWDALILDLGMVVFYLVYTLVFNWCYDHGRHYLMNRKLMAD